MACLVDTFKPCFDTSRDLAQIVYNPMFNDLQATLATDCILQSVPYFLVQGQGHTEPPVSHGNTDLLVEDATLQAEFRQLAPMNNTRVSELETFYNTQSASTLTYRSDALVLAQQKGLSTDQLMKEIHAINTYYDEQQAHLTVRISKSLQLLKCMLPSELAQPGGVTKKNKVRQLNANAVSIMTEWYETHLDNPYPTPVEKELMAHKGDISISQVKAWFANKRNRSMNTKPKREKQKLQKQLSVICQQIQAHDLDLNLGFDQQVEPAYGSKLDLNQNYSEMLDNLATMVQDRSNELLYPNFGYDQILGDLQM